MFEDDGWVGYDAAATLDAAVEYDTAENQAALGKLQATLHFADLHATLPPTARTTPNHSGERLVVHGGDGCPPIAEFAPAELGALLKMSSGAAATYIGEALALRHRLPRIWAKTLNGDAIVWRARAVARACLKLSAEAAALVDERVVAVIDTLSAYRLQKIVDAVVKEADPAAARQAAEDHARQRGVWVQPSDDDGTKTIWVKAASGDVIAIDASINDVAWALRQLGDPDPLNDRRAKALGWLADPLAAYELLNAARYLATHPTTGEAEPNPPRTDAPKPPHAPSDTEHTPPNAPDSPTGNSLEVKPHLPKAPADRRTASSTQVDPDPPDGSVTDPADHTSEAEPNPPGPSPATPADKSPGDNLRPPRPSTAKPARNYSADESEPPGASAAQRANDCSAGESELPGASAAQRANDCSVDESELPGACAAQRVDDCSGDESELPGALAAHRVDDYSADESEPSGASAAQRFDDYLADESELPGASAAQPADDSARDKTRPARASSAERAADSSGGEPELPAVLNEQPPSDWDEPAFDDEPDRHAPHPSIGEELASPIVSPTADTRAAIDPYSRHQLASKLATIKNAAGSTWPGAVRPGRIVLYAHITDQALLTGDGLIRIEDHGSLLAAQLKELLGHRQVILKPVIDLNQHLDVNAYEIPTRIRERVKLAQPAERFPYGTTETTPHTDLDHIQPYDPHGPPGQTSTANLTPATRYHHRVKTHGHWTVHHTNNGALHWTTPNGYTFHVDHTGTHRLT
ncbi:HNH endonuclease signature motif containing protein [Kribbella ginsengisoli]|uniref:DUF222 domain-containing protein n=1 Tax=Kribbella ginsengisoli TaxID=363865 RepID=A0ABP6XAU6_9ACTN